MIFVILATAGAALGMLFTYLVGRSDGYRAKRRHDDRASNSILHRIR